MTYPNDYVLALGWLLDAEGGYSNHPADPGGETMYGIARNFWPQYWEEGVPTMATAEAFYWKEFWQPMRLGSFVFYDLRREMLEAGVNCGAGNGIKFCQRAYNLLRPESWAELTVDGKVGPKTLRAVNRFSERDEYSTALLAGFNYYQADYYAHLRNRKDFIRGWFANRLRW